MNYRSSGCLRACAGTLVFAALVARGPAAGKAPPSAGFVSRIHAPYPLAGPAVDDSCAAGPCPTARKVARRALRHVHRIGDR